MDSEMSGVDDEMLQKILMEAASDDEDDEFLQEFKSLKEGKGLPSATTSSIQAPMRSPETTEDILEASPPSQVSPMAIRGDADPSISIQNQIKDNNNFDNDKINDKRNIDINHDDEMINNIDTNHDSEQPTSLVHNENFEDKWPPSTDDSSSPLPLQEPMIPDLKVQENSSSSPMSLTKSTESKWNIGERLKSKSSRVLDSIRTSFKRPTSTPVASQLLNEERSNLDLIDQPLHQEISDILDDITNSMSIFSNLEEDLPKGMDFTPSGAATDLQREKSDPPNSGETFKKQEQTHSPEAFRSPILNNNNTQNLEKFDIAHREGGSLPKQFDPDNNNNNYERTPLSDMADFSVTKPDKNANTQLSASLPHDEDKHPTRRNFNLSASTDELFTGENAISHEDRGLLAKRRTMPVNPVVHTKPVVLDEPAEEDILASSDDEDDEFMKDYKRIQKMKKHHRRGSSTSTNDPAFSSLLSNEFNKFSSPESTPQHSRSNSIASDITSTSFFSQPKKKDLNRLDSDSDTPNLTPRKSKAEPPVPPVDLRIERNIQVQSVGHSTILQLERQFSSPQFRENSGLPTVMTLQYYFIIGTSRGQVLFFDSKYNIEYVVNSPEHGAISALDVQIDPKSGTNWVVCGHESGHIVLWDFVNQKIIKAAQVHSTSVSFLRFLNDPMRFISSDDEGIVYISTVLKGVMFWGLQHQKVLDGKDAGTVFAMSVLKRKELPPSQMQLYSKAQLQHTLIVFATMERLFLLSVSGASIKIPWKANRPKSSDFGALPCLSICETPKFIGRSVPVLASTWGRVVQLIQLVDDFRNSKILKTGNSWKVPTEITAVEWLNSRVLLLMNIKNELEIYDPFSRKMLQSIKTDHFDLVYHSRFSPILGGYATNAPSKHSFSGSTFSTKKGTLFLGLKTIHVFEFLNWKEQIQALLPTNAPTTTQSKKQTGSWLAALLLAEEFWTSEGFSVEIGLPSNPVERKSMVADFIEEILTGFCEDTTRNYLSTNTSSIINKRYRLMGKICLQYCTLINRMEFLFSYVYEVFQKNKKEPIFLYLLQPFILEDRLGYIDPGALQRMVDLYASVGRVHEVEEMILHLDISSIDFHQVVTLCRTHNLFSALFYLYNKGLDDFISPLLELLGVINSLRNQTPDFNPRPIFDQICSYIAFCLLGKRFPEGSPLPQQRVDKLISEILEFIFDKDQNGQFPRVLEFLHMDAQNFLQTLEVCFKPKFALPPFMSHQFFVDTFISILENHKKSLTLTQKEETYLFLARHGLQARSKIPEKYIHEVLFSLLQMRDNKSINEPPSKRKQDIVQQMVEKLHFSGAADKILEEALLLAEGNQFFKVAEFLYLEQRNFAKAIHCRLRAIDSKETTFSFIKEILASKLSEKEKGAIKESLIAGINLKELISLDPSGTALLINSLFPDSADRVIKELTNFPKLKYAYLSCLFHKDRVPEALANGPRPSHLILEYLTLMARIEPKQVAPYLRAHLDFPFEATLELCKTQKLTEAISLLLEKAGDYIGALQTLLVDFSDQLKGLRENFSAPQISQLKLLAEERLMSCITLCQRCQTKDRKSDNEFLWFSLFDTIVKPLTVIQEKKKRHEKEMQEDPETILSLSKGDAFMIETLSSFLQSLLQSTTGFISLPTILLKILKDHRSAEFGDVKWMIKEMMEAYNYETSILTTLNHLLNGDISRATTDLVKKSARAIRPKSLVCNLCKRPFDALQKISSVKNKPLNKQPKVVLFRCGHGFHRACLEKPSCPFCSQNE